MSKLGCLFGVTTQDLIDDLNYQVEQSSTTISNSSVTVQNKIIPKQKKKTRTNHKIIRNVPKVK